MKRMSEADADYWSDRIFDQDVAVETRRRFVEDIGHEFLPIEHRVNGELVVEDVPVVEPDIPFTARREWSGALPRSPKSLKASAEKVGYSTRVAFHHGERRGAHGRLLDPPDADYCTLGAVRGQDKWLVMWVDVKGTWKFDTALDWTPDGESLVLPVTRKLQELKGKRL